MVLYRYIVQHAGSGDVQHWNVPLSEVEFGPELSGPGSLHATVSPGFTPALSALLDPGNTVLYVERGGTLLWGGILWRAEPQGEKIPIEAAGFTSYLHRRHVLEANLGGRGPYVEADPSQVIRDVWAYAQQARDGDLQVQVDASKSRASVGTAKDPYALEAWDARALGEVVDDMADLDGGPEWTEAVTWEAGRAQRRIVLGTPRLGRRRDDISFTTGVNLAVSPQVVLDGDAYAQAVIALGAGEGKKRLLALDETTNGRLRLEHRLDASGEKDAEKLKARAAQERRARQTLGSVEELAITDHPAARLTGLRIGDEVGVKLREEQVLLDSWFRIIGWTIRPPQGDSPETITLKLSRADLPDDGGEAS